MFIDTPGSSWTSNWVNGVSPTGTFVKNTEAFWELSGVNGIPEGWNIEYDGILVNDADIYIQHIDNTLYTTEEWVTNGFSNEDANGVAVVAEEAKFVVAKTSPEGRVYWSSNRGALLEDICTASSIEAAKADLLGQHNTQVMLATDTYGASYVCANYAFPNGEKGYLPALGELFVVYRNKYNINNALNLIGGGIESISYWSSTQCTATVAWYIDLEEGDISTKYKADSVRVIPFLPLNI
jgi:hypothetical protein